MPVRGSAAKMYRRHARRNEAFVKREAYRAMNASREAIRALTPVGRRVDPRTGMDLGPSGRTRRSVTGIRPRQIPSRRPGEIVYRTGAYSNLLNARRLEYGTSPHMIFRKRKLALHFWNFGGEVFARHAEHPGFEGKHMFALGIHVALAEQLAGVRGRWRVEVARADG